MKQRLNRVAPAVFIIVSAALAWLAYSYGGMDFNVYYAAARVSLQGGNPYDFQQLAPQILNSAGRLNNPYYYAPWFTWSVLPFALFPYRVARVLWALAHFLLWMFALVNLSKLIDYPKSGWKKWGMWLLVTFVFAWSTWGAEQVGVLILFLFTRILLAAEKKNWTAVGILLALTLFKPNIAALPVGLIALWLLLRQRTWKPLLVMSATLALLLSLALILDPKFYLPLLAPDKIQGLSYTLDSSGGLEVKRYTATLSDFLRVYGIEGGAATAIYALVVSLGIAAAALGMYSSATLVEWTAIAIAINFAVIPYALFYDYPALVIPLFYGNDLLLKQKGLRYAANALLVVSLFIGRIIPYRYWMVVILSALLTVGYYQRFSKIAASSER
ncbi:MAG: hypothetical protein Fur002_22790 [Anaerolineales bacterium]